MKKATLANINAVAKEFGMELVKGEGYFYWINTDPDFDKVFWGQVDETSVYVYRVEDMAYTEWIKDLVEKFNKFH